MSYNSKETDVYCECIHSEPNKDLLEGISVRCVIYGGKTHTTKR